MRKQIIISVMLVLSVLIVVSTVAGVRVFAQATGTETAVSTGKTITPEQASISRFAFMAAAVAFGLGAIGAGIAIGNVGAAAMGAVAEKPEIAGQALIFVALAEGLVVFGFITALMILGKV